VTTTFTISEVHTYYSNRVPGLKQSGKELRGPCPVHRGKDANFSVNMETGLAQCHSQCGRGFDIISLEMELAGVAFPQAKERVYDLVGRPRVPWEDRNIEATYDYTDEAGKLLYQVVRLHGKQFRQRRPDGQGGWSWGLGDAPRVPFQLPKLKGADFAAVCEGEKDCRTLERLGIVATCNNGGAGNFKAELVPYFTDKRIAIFPDNDEPGRDHALKVAALLTPVAKSLKIVELPDLPAKGDVTDFINAGGTVEQIRELYRKAQSWTPEWQFAIDVPDENEKYIRTIEQEVEAAGGLTEFWNLGKFTGMPTPFGKLNWILGGGMRPGEVYILGGKEGSGKTSLALQVAMETLRKGHAVLIFSMEMDRPAVYRRMAGIEARVDLHSFADDQRRKVDVGERMARLCRATSTMSGRKLLVSTKPRVTPQYITSEIKRIATRSRVDLVIVDHAQLMDADGPTRGDYERMTKVSRALKITAGEIGAPLLAVSQTNRSKKRGEKNSELDSADLRDTGALEEDAAGVWLMFEDSHDAEAAKTDARGHKRTRYMIGPVKTLLKVAKNRYGIQGAYVGLNHYKSETRFEAQESGGADGE
jgi:replicative DNA helicase